MTDTDNPTDGLEKSRNGQPQLNAASLALAELVERTARAIYDARGPNDMHPGQWALLRFLARTDVERRTLDTVSAHLGVTAGPASRALAALERKGLLRIRPRADDRRRRDIRVTKSGRALLEDDPLNRLAGLIDGLDPDDAVRLRQILAGLRAGLSAPDQT